MHLGRPVPGLPRKPRARRKLNADLHDAEREVRDIRYALDQAAIVAITDAAGVITFVNERFCEISKYSRSELLGKTHRIINSGVHPPEFFADLWKTISHGEVWRGEICNRAKDGSLYWVHTVIVPFFSADGQPRQYIALRTDITDKKRALEEARKAVATREEFLAIVSHDLKNPLSSIAINAELIGRLLSNLSGGFGSARIFELAATIQRSAARMQDMIRDLLDMSRIEAEGLELHWEKITVGEFLSEGIEMIAAVTAARNIRVEKKFGSESLQICCDRGRILQVLSNLLGNAVKFSGEGGLVRLEAEEIRSGVEIRVLDSGPGIPAWQIPNLFRRFWRSDPRAGGGTGLGLYISKWIVDAHGGNIWARNREGGGAAFGFWVPGSRPLR